MIALPSGGPADRKRAKTADKSVQYRLANPSYVNVDDRTDRRSASMDGSDRDACDPIKVRVAKTVGLDRQAAVSRQVPG